MAASVKPAGRPAGGRRSRTRRHAPMSEINVTPFVDVMLVLLIIFMVTAPLLTAGVPLDLPAAKGRPLPTPNKEPLTVSVNRQGKVYIQDNEFRLEEIADKLKAIASARGQSEDDAVFVRGDRSVDYGTVMKVMARLSSAGFRKVSLVTDVEDRS